MKKSALLLLIALTCTGANAQQTKNPDQNTQAPQLAELAEATRLSLAAVSLYNQGKYEEALSPAKRALEMREKLLTRDDGLVISATLNLAEIQLLRDKPREAWLLFDRALRSYERVFGADDMNLIKVLDRLAVAYYRIGNSDQTEKAFKRALAIGEKSVGPDHSDLGPLIFNLAEFYQFQGEYKKAEPLYRRLIAIREKARAGEESLAEARERYGCLLRKTKRFDEAVALEAGALGASVPMATGNPLEGGVVNGRAIDLVRPPYPQEALAKRVSGTVTVRVLIDETGRVIRACAIEGPGLFMKAAESAARRSRFTSTLLSGTAVKVNGVIIYNFQ